MNQCPDCRKRKPGMKSDCAIYKAVFQNRSENAMNNLDKFFDGNKCKYISLRSK